jgi:hypothetical protein
LQYPGAVRFGDARSVIIEHELQLVARVRGAFHPYLDTHM